MSLSENSVQLFVAKTDTMKANLLLRKYNLGSGLAGLAAIAGLYAGCSQKPQQPNIVIIYADDVGYGDLSWYNAKAPPIPRADWLVKEGLKFNNTHCYFSASTPSRYSLLTGECAWRKRGTGVAPDDAAAIIEPGPGAKININTNTEMGNDTVPQLINLKTDIGEKLNIAADNQLIVNDLTELIGKIKEEGRTRF